MPAAHRSLADRLDEVARGIGKLQINLKLIPDVDGTPKIAQLVGYNLQDITVHGAWDGDARLHLIPHVNCRVADLPVRRIVGGVIGSAALATRKASPASALITIFLEL